MSSLTLSNRIDIQGLLEPISLEHPAGESLRYEGTYDRIHEARREDDQTLSQGIYKTQLKRANWEADEAICLDALEHRTKDLQIAGWLLEAWMHLHGFRGVEAGLRLLVGLCENFWDDLYPKIEAGDLEGRIAPIEWINEKLSLKLKLIPLTQPRERNERSYSYADWESACHFENLAMRDPRALQQALANIDPTVSTVQAAVLETDASFHMELVRDLEDSISACTSLQQLLDEKCGKHSPGLHQFNEVLCSVLQLIAREAWDGALSLVESEPEATFGAEPGEHGGFETSGPIRSRADAYRRLTEAADYLLKTEPHSPTPYLVKRAVEWGHMSLFEVLQQMIRNQSELEEIDRLLRLNGNRAA